MPTRPHIPSEEELLAEARQVIEPLSPVEPRAGFAAMVALNARDRLVSNITGHLLNGVTEPVLKRAYRYWKNVDPDLGESVEKGVRAGQS